MKFDFTTYIPILTLVVSGTILWFLFMLYKQSKHKKEVINHLFCEIVTGIGTTDHKLLPIENGAVVDKEKSAEYIYDESATYNCAYPPGKNKLEQVIARKAFYHEGNPEPAIKRGTDPIVTDTMMFNRDNEKGTKVAMQIANEVKVEADILRKGLLNPMFTYILLIIIGVGVLVAAYFGMKNGQLLEAMKIPLGIK